MNPKITCGWPPLRRRGAFRPRTRPPCAPVPDRRRAAGRPDGVAGWRGRPVAPSARQTAISGCHRGRNRQGRGKPDGMAREWPAKECGLHAVLARRPGVPKPTHGRGKPPRMVRAEAGGGTPCPVRTRPERMRAARSRFHHPWGLQPLSKLLESAKSFGFKGGGLIRPGAVDVDA